MTYELLLVIAQLCQFSDDSAYWSQQYTKPNAGTGCAVCEGREDEMSKPLDLTKPIQFRDPSYGTIISVVPNPDGPAHVQLIVNFMDGESVGTAFRFISGRSSETQKAYSDIINVSEKKRFECWLVFWEDNRITHVHDVAPGIKVGDKAYGSTVVHVEHIVREVEV